MFNRKCSLIGMIHLLPLPGAAGYQGSIEQIMTSALDEAMTYKEQGFDALLIENMHDAPYFKGKVEPETLAAMTVISSALKYETQMPLGIQILAGANLEALAAAIAASLDFIRVEGFVFAHVGDEGIHESCAAHLIRRRWNLKAEHIKIFADIKKKHSAHAITSDVSIADTAKAAEYFRADGVIVTGTFAGDPPALEDLRSVRKTINCNVLVGSGVTEQNLHEFMPLSDALIIGSALKENGKWYKHLDTNRVASFVNTARKIESRIPLNCK